MSGDDMVLTPMGLRFQGRVIPCAIGKTGLTPAKREGDGATPVGRHRITGLWYRPDRVARPAPWAREARGGCCAGAAIRPMRNSEDAARVAGLDRLARRPVLSGRMA